ncbi:MAG: AAA domain-containing protein, partial [Candidatus Eisenbacteria bacterium]|nr:AAA domain-containing protein [Candidatus Eisenbacteria bacterium]
MLLWAGAARHRVAETAAGGNGSEVASPPAPEFRDVLLEARAALSRLPRRDLLRQADTILEEFWLQCPWESSEATDGAGEPEETRRIRASSHYRRHRRIGVGSFLTRDPGLLRALEELEPIADSDLPVLIEGESGTGKELIARAIHDASRRRSRPFVPINCGAVPGELHESEFFGHLRGSFTGALTDKIGLFEQAHGGTVFLDEVGEMEPQAQVKLLRILESGELRRVGETQLRHVDVRIVAATNSVL